MTDNENLKPKLEPIIRKAQVCEIFGISPATLYRKIQAGEFPPPIELGANSKGWFEGDLLQAQAKMREARDGE